MMKTALTLPPKSFWVTVRGPLGPPCAGGPLILPSQSGKCETPEGVIMSSISYHSCLENVCSLTFVLHHNVVFSDSLVHVRVRLVKKLGAVCLTEVKSSA